MIIETLIQLITWIFIVFLELVSSIFSAFSFSVPDLAGGIGYIFGNIWLLNFLLPIDTLFTILSLALIWKTSLFAYDGTLYAFEIVNLLKRTFFSVGG